MPVCACQLLEHLRVWTNASNKGCWHSIPLVPQQKEIGQLCTDRPLGADFVQSTQQPLVLAAEGHTVLWPSEAKIYLVVQVRQQH